MGKWDCTLVLFQSCKHLHEDLLCQIFLRNPSGQMRPDNADDQGIEVVDEFPRGHLVAPAYPVEASGQIERRNDVVRHERMEARTCTASKTQLGKGRLQRRANWCMSP